MDKKQINDPKMTLNFLIWVGGVFMLSLFAPAGALCLAALLGGLVRPQKVWPHFWGHVSKRRMVGDFRKGYASCPSRQLERHFGKCFEEKRVRVIALGCGLFRYKRKKHLLSQSHGRGPLR
jgi:hypothetical protein